MLQALGRHLQKSRSHQEAGAERHEVAQIALDAASTYQHQSASYICQRGNDAENQGEPEHACLPAVPDVHHVAIMHDVLLALKAERALRARGGFAAGGEQVDPSESFRRE